MLLVPLVPPEVGATPLASISAGVSLATGRGGLQAPAGHRHVRSTARGKVSPRQRYFVQTAQTLVAHTKYRPGSQVMLKVSDLSCGTDTPKLSGHEILLLQAFS